MESNFSQYAKKRIRVGDPLSVTLLLLGLFLAASAVYFCSRAQWRDVGLAGFFLLLLPCFYFAEYFLRLRFPPLFLGMVGFMIVGSFLGCGYDLYTVFPASDKILHGVSGLLFASLGCALAQARLGADADKHFFFCLLFGVLFSLSVAVVWELFERLSDRILPVDMQEDDLIRGFNSYFLSGTHDRITRIEDISKTVIYYGDGQTLTLDGYLDVGLKDTVGDVAACFLGCILWLAALAFDRKRSGRLYSAIVPAVLPAESLRRQDS